MQVIRKFGAIVMVSLVWSVAPVATGSEATRKPDFAQATLAESVSQEPSAPTKQEAGDRESQAAPANPGNTEDPEKPAGDRESQAAPANPGNTEDAAEDTEDAAQDPETPRVPTGDRESQAAPANPGNTEDRESQAEPANPGNTEDAAQDTEDAAEDTESAEENVNSEVAGAEICAPVADESKLELNIADPSNPSSWINQGKYFLRAKLYQEAMIAYYRAIGLDANEADAWIGCGSALEMLSEYEKAIQALDRAIEIKPEYSLAWFNRGKVLKQSGRYEEALTAMERSLQGNGEWGNHTAAEVWANKGSVLSKLDKLEEAISAFDKAIKLDPEYALAWFNQGTVFLKQGVVLAQDNENDEAKVAFEEAVESYDRALVSQGQWGEIRGPASAWYNRGIALERLERYEEAIESYDQALKIIPNHTKARQRLVALRERLQ
ncbi:MAG: tetratricopeptide repeat protein [Oscillatoria sp. SIO1A7]|nr:tetratricopeptide repeat protein [Oscillatoria sp. SIO1A7]